MNAAIDDTVLVLTRALDAPPAQVFNAWLEREQFQAWIGPEGLHCDVPLLEARVGGRYLVNMKLSDSNVVPVSGEFRVIEAPRRLVFTWGWEGDPKRQSLITLTFEQLGPDRTLLTLRQEGLGDVENRDAHGKGWNSALNKLVAYLTSNSPQASVRS